MGCRNEQVEHRRVVKIRNRWKCRCRCGAGLWQQRGKEQGKQRGGEGPWMCGRLLPKGDARDGEAGQNKSLGVPSRRSQGRRGAEAVGTRDSRPSRPGWRRCGGHGTRRGCRARAVGERKQARAASEACERPRAESARRRIGLEQTAAGSWPAEEAPRGHTEPSEVKLGVSECSASRRGKRKDTAAAAAAACGAERVGADVLGVQQWSDDIRNEDMSWEKRQSRADSSKVSVAAG